ncbi:MAG: hypothetical protein ABSA93_29845 [Streptosporangiaceae bacterium]
MPGSRVGQAILTSPARHATLSSPGALRAVAGDGYVFAMLMLPIIVAGLPGSIGNDVERFLPESVGSVMINNPVPRAFGPWTEFAILCGYTVLILAVSSGTLTGRQLAILRPVEEWRAIGALPGLTAGQRPLRIQLVAIGKCERSRRSSSWPRNFTSAAPPPACT